METKNRIPVTPAKPTTTEIHYLMVLDESGSMDCIKSSTMENFNSQVSELKKLQQDFPDQKYTVSLLTFNTEIKERINEQHSDNVQNLSVNNYNPSGGTALYDAIGRGVTRIQEVIGGDQSKKAIAIIITDGEENSSRDPRFNSSEKIGKLIKEAQEDGRWTFVFIGANQDSITTAKSMNIPVSNSMSFASDEESVMCMASALNHNTRLYAMNVSRGLDVTADFAATGSSLNNPTVTTSKP